MKETPSTKQETRRNDLRKILEELLGIQDQRKALDDREAQLIAKLAESHPNAGLGQPIRNPIWSYPAKQEDAIAKDLHSSLRANVVKSPDPFSRTPTKAPAPTTSFRPRLRKFSIRVLSAVTSTMSTNEVVKKVGVMRTKKNRQKVFDVLRLESARKDPVIFKNTDGTFSPAKRK